LASAGSAAAELDGLEREQQHGNDEVAAEGEDAKFQPG